MMTSFDTLLPSPIHKVHTLLCELQGIHLWVKRDDLIHEQVSGNKYRKLKYNLTKIKSEGKKQVITFGGAFSNHIHAIAAVCRYEGLDSIGIIRGELDLANPTQKFCIECGMKLIPVPRSSYKLKTESDEIQNIIHQYPEAVVIPEGGTNALALYGVSEVIDEINMEDLPTLDYLILACGTGGTTAGLLSSPNLNSCIISISALKSNHLKSEILELAKYQNADKLEVNTDYHFGGYAKYTQELLDFIDDFEVDTGIPLDHIYTGKAMYALMDMIKNGRFDSGTNILFLHTGGLQGKEGLRYMQEKKQERS
ncbi:MAG: 1-aminocyclopropane-1-carboxylate deaminase/D-cysteine desulfhydrase [Saprospiraceae bacterium]|nr:MAG: 1-aminocyclopropane-1-carboxylate deaminase [Bacteroidetes bacterium OLB9]MCO6462793.1 1-aminocyclopropane-1-carboxylate deaminase/D-cysteine desulfhydrase [Saprospiraceae bacterium]